MSYRLTCFFYVSTGESELLKAQVKAELWKVGGLPTGRARKPRPVEEAAGIESIISIIGKSEINADDALRIVAKLKNMGLIDISAVRNTGRGAVPFVRFLETFWDFDKSEYIQDRLSHGYRFSRRYAHECQNRLEAERGLATSTINQILLVCCTPLKWAFNEKIIP